MQSQSNAKPVLGSGDDSTGIWKSVFPQRASLVELSSIKMIVNQVCVCSLCGLAQQEGLNEQFERTFPSDA